MFTPDSALPGLYVKTLKDSSVWVVRAKQHGTRNSVTVTIGRTDVFTPAQARAEAKQALAALSRGENPNQKRKIAEEDAKRLERTLEDALEEYLAAKPRKATTVQSYRDSMRRSFGDWYDKKIGAITKDQVVTRFIEIQRKIAKRTKWKTQANPAGLPEALKAMRYLSAVLEYFVTDQYGEELVLPKGNPVAVLKAKKLKPTLKVRERYLSDAERQDLLELLGQAHHPEYKGKVKQDAADYLFLLLVSGMRKNEARTLQWADIDADTLTVRETKNSKPLVLPITNAIRRLLERRRNDSPFVFPYRTGKRPAAFKYAVGHACKELGFKFTIHDLRRTVATVASEQGYSLDQIAALLNHSKQGVTAGYVARTVATVLPLMQAVEDALLKPWECDPNPPEPTEADDAALGLPTKPKPASSNVVAFRARRG